MSEFSLNRMTEIERVNEVKSLVKKSHVGSFPFEVDQVNTSCVEWTCQNQCRFEAE